MSQTNDVQVQATAGDLLELLTRLKEHGVEALVHGGWALDALSGTSRMHSDIDLLIHEEDRDRVRALFADRVLVETSHKLEVQVGNTSADIVFFRRMGRGFATVTPRIIVLWPPDLLSGKQMRRINGSEIPIVNARVLYYELANTVRKKAPMLNKNQRDLRVIAPHIDDKVRKCRRYLPRPNTFWNRMRLKLRLL